MNTQPERPNVSTQASSLGSTVGLLAAGLGIGAALSILFAPQSGEETRKWIAGKCLNAVEAANEKVRESRVQMKEVIDRSQQQVSDAVAAGREAIGTTKVATKPGGAPVA